MKKLFFLLACVAMSVLSFGQDNQLVWANGHLLYGTPIESIDSLTYDEMQDIDTLHLLLPRTLIKVAHDTVVETQIVHDTVIETQIVHDTVVETQIVHDTIIQIEMVYDTIYMIGDYEYVDLGLSVKWATCNVGANSPEEYGDYFAWGEVEPIETYGWSTYKWCNGSYDSLTKYNNSSSYGIIDNKTVLDASDDAATANWGGSWRMPTDAELTELRENCTWIWTTQNGVNGYRVTSNKEGYTDKSIFLPAAGYRYDSSLHYAGSDGFYWSSSLYTGSPLYAYVLYFDSGGVNWGNGYRDYGRSVRPVCQ